MSILKRNGTRSNQFPALFDNFLNRELFNWNTANYSDTNSTVPAVNIRETPDNYVVEVAAPGMSKKDFTVQLDGNTLTISSEKRNEEQQNDSEKYSRKEFSYQSFFRTFHLPKEVVDSDKIHAKYDSGILKLVVPKREEAKQKPPRMITIS